MLLSTLNLIESKEALKDMPMGKIVINTLNAHSYNMAQKDAIFTKALVSSDYLIPDGGSIVKACHFIKASSRPKERIAGWDLFVFEMHQNESMSMARKKGEKMRRVMFMGSSNQVLEKIKENAASDYPNLEIVTYSPPYKSDFSDDDNAAIIDAINEANPDLLWIGMTAPKQEKWTYQHWTDLKINCHVGNIGAVFDFYAGTIQRAPLWWQNHSLEWLYRLLKEPKRMWKRYIIGNPLFIWHIIKEL